MTTKIIDIYVTMFFFIEIAFIPLLSDVWFMDEVINFYLLFLYVIIYELFIWFFKMSFLDCKYHKYPASIV